MSEVFTLTKADLQNIIEQAINKFKVSEKPKKKYISIKEFVDIFGMHRQSIHELILKKKINAMQMSGTTAWRIPITEITRYEQESGKSTKKNIFKRSF